MSPQRFAKLQQVLAMRQPDLTVVMENVHKVHNFAAIVRSLDAVGAMDAHAVFLQQNHQQQASSAVGSNKWVDVHYHQKIEQPLTALKKSGHQLLAANLSERAVDFRQVDYCLPTAIIMGSELFGVSDQTLQQMDAEIIIPMCGLTQSLNVSVAAALILFEAQRQRQAANMYAKSRLCESEFKRKLFEWSYPKIAQICQREQRPYPAVDDSGFLVGNSFSKRNQQPQHANTAADKNLDKN